MNNNIIVNRDEYLEAIKRVVALEEECIEGVRVMKYQIAQRKYAALTTVYTPVDEFKIKRETRKAYKEGKKLGLEKEQVKKDITKATNKMRNRITKKAEEILGI